MLHHVWLQAERQYEGALSCTWIQHRGTQGERQGERGEEGGHKGRRAGGFRGKFWGREEGAGSRGQVGQGPKRGQEEGIEE